MTIDPPWLVLPGSFPQQPPQWLRILIAYTRWDKPPIAGAVCWSRLPTAFGVLHGPCHLKKPSKWPQLDPKQQHWDEVLPLESVIHLEHTPLKHQIHSATDLQMSSNNRAFDNSRWGSVVLWLPVSLGWSG